MKKKILLIVLCLLSMPLCATHIVGGEFEFIFKGLTANGHYRYKLGLILYFDNVNGAEGAADAAVNIRMFSKRDNSIIKNIITLTLRDRTPVEYFQPLCSRGLSIETDRLYYSYTENDVEVDYILDPNDFTDPMGYYMAWERCCRNYTITNIFSQNPEIEGSTFAGQTFYLEFPPLKINQRPFYNSSPTLFPPLSDYACLNQYYYVDFAGTDPDGDSLVYSLVDPLNTFSGLPVPAGGLPNPGPYPIVNWRQPFGLNNIMGGNPDLNISRDGLLTVTPRVAGLFVFAVKCEEFRFGKKIGEVRRDFQMVVLSQCERAVAPVITAKRKQDASYVANTLSVSFDASVPDEERCIDIRITDEDSKTAPLLREEITVRAIPIGFKKDISGITFSQQKITLTNGSAGLLSVCFPSCPFSASGNYKIGLVAGDDACPLPRLDTIIVNVYVEPPPNVPPKFDKNLVQAVVTEGTFPFPKFTFEGTDADDDVLRIVYDPKSDVDLAWYGFSFTPPTPAPGPLKAELTWNTRCDQVNFGDRTSFRFSFLLKDNDACDITPDDKITFNLTMDLSKYNKPLIKADAYPKTDTLRITQRVYDPLVLNVTGTDPDPQPIYLTGTGSGFSSGATFPEVKALNEVKSVLTWTPACNQYSPDKSNRYNFLLMVVDKEYGCIHELRDSLVVQVTVAPPLNLPPILEVNNLTTDLNLSYLPNTEIKLDLKATDANTNPQDRLVMQLVDAMGDVNPEGYTFTSTPGTSPIDGTFTWAPGCEIYRNGDYENDYLFRFRVYDNRCHTARGDTVVVRMKIKDIENNPDVFIPPNIVTPNGDDKNEFFAMVREDEEKNLVSILPKDNCEGRFVNIIITNRWGREVFRSTDRDFRWYPEVDPGVYFYVLRYSHRQYRGTVTVAGALQRYR